MTEKSALAARRESGRETALRAFGRISAPGVNDRDAEALLNSHSRPSADRDDRQLSGGMFRFITPCLGGLFAILIRSRNVNNAALRTIG